MEDAAVLFNNHVKWNKCLLYACEIGKLKQTKEIIKKYLESGGLGVELDWDKGLLEACKYGHFKIVKLMIFHGASNLLRGFLRACNHGQWRIVKYFVSNGIFDWNAGLIAASTNGHLGLIQKLISLAEAIAHTQETTIKWNWNKPLDEACFRGQLDIAKFMVAKGANEFHIAFHFACSGNHLPVVNFLLEHGFGDSCIGLAIAFKQKNAKMIKLMVNYGAYLCKGTFDQSGCNNISMFFKKKFIIELFEEGVSSKFMHDLHDYSINNGLKKTITRCFQNIESFQIVVMQLDILLPELRQIVSEYSLM